MEVDKPWVVLGDFDCLENLNERIGQTVRLQEVMPLRSCMQDCGWKDMKFSGRFFTWNTNNVVRGGSLVKLIEFFVMRVGITFSLDLKHCFSLRELLITPLWLFNSSIL